jgi:ABC-2 type transport system permease protein
MNRTLLARTFRDSLWLLAGACALMFIFVWARVWVSAQFKTQHLKRLLSEFAPDFIRKLLPVDIEVIASTTGRLALSYEEPLALALMSFWAISRGSDVVAGELGRGSLEMTLAQPVRRIEWLTSHSLITLLGVAAIASAAWLGTWSGIQTVTLEEQVPARTFAIAAFNLFSLGVFLAGLSTLLSSFDSVRSRVVGIVVAIYAVQLIQKVVARAAPDEYVNVKRLGDWSFLSAFEPQVLVHGIRSGAPEAWATFWDYNGVLLALGLFGVAVAAAIFQHRDLPAPL